MKIVKEYLDFETFKAKCDQNIYPLVVEKVEKYFSQKEIDELKKIKSVFIGSFILGTLSAIGAILSFVYGVSNSFRDNYYKVKLYSALAILILSLIFFIIGFIFLYKFRSAKLIINRKIANELGNSDLIYQKAFKNISSEIEYVTPNDSNFKTLLSQNDKPHLTKQDLSRVEPDCETPPVLVSSNKIASWIIDNKYPVEYYFLHWQYVVQRKDRDEIRNVFRGLIKVYNHKMGDKTFDWSLTAGSFSKNWLAKKLSKGMELENREFNSNFTLKADQNNRQNIFRIFTPYAQELLVKRINDTQGTLVNSFKLISSDNEKSVIYDFVGISSFMQINAKLKLDIQQVIKGYYSDILYDSYTFYFLLCFVYIPLYFE
ncbi:Uncharacterised protein [Mycoplasmopsis citelli]|uniref:Uncharacterized protein n=1 Tax=Mycoplasmopsis citelli TaxID=171281 RepID=A0A449B2P7_9BACT|nr:hypothetical protein [Mycoplasmopsis citelli]VEU74853.1 Uncharacterised protein [Mycoplasmopsis citelli]